MTVLTAHAATGILRDFGEAGVLAPADVHVARRLCALSAVDDDTVLLAAALAVRAPRLGHTLVDLDGIRERAAVDVEEEVDVAALPWPAVDAWIDALRSSPLVAVGEDATAADRPLRLIGSSLYLDRYWREERQVAADLLALAVPVELDEGRLRDALERLFPGETGARQSLAAASALLRRFAVVAGGPGTGKTTTVARIVALLHALEARPPQIALAAPTNTAAVRLQQAVRGEADTLAVGDDARAFLRSQVASSLHSLLGLRPSSSRARHDRTNRLPHDVVIVDETSMVPLSLMAKLVAAVRPAARLILVGDPGQLTSIEAGVVLGDIVGDGADRLALTPEARSRLEIATGAPVEAASSGSAIADGVIVLKDVYRHGEEIARVAEAIRRGDADATLHALEDEPDDKVRWIRADPADPAAAGALEPIRERAVATAGAVIAAARDGDRESALRQLPAFRVLCAHRRGAHGVSTWTERIERWLAESVPGFSPDTPWYPGRPLLVTQNDHALRLYNGDTGVVVATGDGRVGAAFARGGDPVTVSPGRLAAIETVYAMTIHKSQGSQFETVAVLLPPATSPLLTRELLYTAVTRARDRVILVATDESLRTAVERPAARASALAARLR